MDSKNLAFWLLLPFLLVGILFLARLNTLDIVTKDNYQELNYYQLAKPRVIKDFSLSDQLDQPVNADSLKGQLSLIFFGFTSCPDVCPTTLSILNMATKNLQHPPRIIMITVDPERDTPAALLPYVTSFNPDFLAYTGSVDDITQLAKQLDSGFRRADDETTASRSFDHTANILVINKEGQYQGLIRPPHQVENLATLLELLAREA